MKKCPSCQREIDPYGIVCEYCNVVEDSRKKEGMTANKADNTPATPRSSALRSFWNRLFTK